jgi:hypothetical protein
MLRSEIKVEILAFLFNMRKAPVVILRFPTSLKTDYVAVVKHERQNLPVKHFSLIHPRSAFSSTLYHLHVDKTSLNKLPALLQH